ncbi:MAG: CoB--CoM heterodisulfide reductase iron-sulfur subunit A family protein [Desulfobacteraceae bacterium]|nr:MAG: CoB--CoM heterodisulfide reductase iron-sulfur subunit A family protein [Desulfobacteraceae bacterium]
MDKCIACGECTKKCPGKTPDEFDQGLRKRKAIYVQYPQAVPLKYVIDPERCIKLTKGKCGTCEKACPAGAINYDDQPETVDINVGSVILASGFKPFDPSALDHYQYANYPNVVTSIEFERILSAGGPTEGHIQCYPDKREPKKIAWLQCIGSRDMNRCDNKYCSSVCCMYAVKEAMMARDHISGDFESAIFYMDMRTYGKDFEAYYERAKDDGVRFVRSRVHTITQNDDHSLALSFVSETGELMIENFDMVVLSVGMETGAELAEQVRSFGIDLNANNFVQTSGFNPVASSRDGIFVCGALQEPKDIPLAVMEASAAACDAGARLVQARGELTQARQYPSEKKIGEEPRIGVFVCNCGSNIGGIVNVPEVAEYARTLPHVAYVEENLFTCAQDTQDKMKAVIDSQDLNRIVIAACTPRTHEALFQETLKDSGLNQYLVEMVNIRNQCSWVHSKEPELATAKSKDLVRMAVAKAALMQPLAQPSVNITQKGLVIGGGLSGLTAAIGLADQGYHATLIEQSPVLGGNALLLNETWDGESISHNMSALIDKARNHERVDIYTDATVKASSGFVGNFKTTITAGEQEIEVDHGALIVATGAKESRPEEYLYGEDERVMTHLEMDNALINSHGVVNNASSVAFIQCVGSREPSRPYCSKVCCTHSMKSAIKLKEMDPDKDVFVLYRDIRTYGQREQLYQKARELGVIFIQYEVENKPRVTGTPDHLTLTVRDHVLDVDMEIDTDILVLATGIIPPENSELARMFKLSLNDDQFFMEAHAKLRPVDVASDGIFLAGMAHYPKPVEESIAQAKAAVSRACVVLSKDSITVDGIVSRINTVMCRGCAQCEEACAFGAIVMQDQEDGSRRAVVQAALCKGCGACSVACPTGAAGVYHFDNEVLTMVESALEI